MWNTILDILRQKAAEGVDVRVIYDDMGCIMILPTGYDRTLEQMGIKCRIFNPFVPILSSRFNTRDHRKICVIDGNVGFTGGINLADEYINAYEKHGHWKDTSILLKGEAVFNLTVMFLSMWDYLDGTIGKTDYSRYYPTVWDENAKGYVQPFADNPLDDEAVGETVYLNLINKAKRYVYITTPYLILSSEMLTALTSAAKCGGGRADHHPPHPGQVVCPRGVPLPLSAAHRGGGENLRVHPRLHPRQDLCGGRRLRGGGHHQPGLSQPLPAL